MEGERSGYTHTADQSREASHHTGNWDQPLLMGRNQTFHLSSSSSSLVHSSFSRLVSRRHSHAPRRWRRHGKGGQGEAESNGGGGGSERDSCGRWRLVLLQ